MNPLIHQIEFMLGNIAVRLENQSPGPVSVNGKPQPGWKPGGSLGW